jgi:hypothetical protein
MIQVAPASGAPERPRSASAAKASLSDVAMWRRSSAAGMKRNPSFDASSNIAARGRERVEH